MVRPLGLAAMLVLPLTAGAAGSPAADEGQVVNAIVALVNNEPVTKLEVDAIVVELLRGARTVSDEQVRAARERAREGLIEQKLLVQEARRRKVEADPEEVNAEVERLRRLGVDAEGRRDLIRERLLVSILLLRLQSVRSITPRQVADYYEKHPADFMLRERRRVHVIAIYAARAGGKAAAKAKAADILDRVRTKGEDFAALAKQHSHGAFADKGGDFGWVEKGALVGPIDEAASKLKPGQVSDLVEAEDGYLIVRVSGVQPASRQSLAEARERIRGRLLAEQRQERRAELLAQLKRAASILRFDLERKP